MLVGAGVVTAIALVIIGLLAQLNSSGALYGMLHQPGTYGFMIGGGTLLLGVLALLAGHRCRQKASTTTRNGSKQPPELSNSSPSYTSNCGSMIIHHEEGDSENKKSIFYISWTGREERETPPGPQPNSPIQPNARIEAEIFGYEGDDEEEGVSVEKFKNLFKENALELLSKQSAADSSDEISILNDEQVEILKQAKGCIRRLRPPKGLTIHGSGDHIVFEIKKLNGLIFKVSKEKSKDRKEVEEYVRLREEARKLCEENHLYMIRIPACSYVEIDGEYFIVEERIEGLNGDYDFQKSLYTWGLDQEELKPYFRDLFNQMLFFTCKFGFGDFKYNNIPLNSTARAIFIDLDTWGAEAGLTEGFANSKEEGLLSYLPQEWLQEFIGKAERHLGKKISSEAVTKRVIQRTERRASYFQFTKKNEISDVSDPVNFVTDSDQLAQSLAKAFCEEINEQLKEVYSFDLQVGRRVDLDFGIKSSFWRKVKEEKFFKSFNSVRNKTGCSFLKNVRPALTLLKERGVIFDFEYRDNFTEAVVYA
ncbi:MAG: hypothetical protein JJU12_02420 [Chlamydiales bacterium]|nr:hypothetical protein [Chlamydiales bacterium]